MNQKKNNRKTFFLLAALLAGVFCVTTQAWALTLSPVRIEVSGDPGQTLSEKMLLINEGTNTETLYSSFTNFEAQGESGDPAFVESNDGLATWISTAPSATLNPGETKSVPFTITIPKDAEAGGHFATLFWGTGENKPGEVAVGAKTGILILLSVNGDVNQNAGFLNFNTVGKRFWYSTLPVSFEYRFRNDGGDRIKPQGFITIRDTIFLPAEKLDANPGEGNILPKSTRKFNVDWIYSARPKDYAAPAGFFQKFKSDVGYQWKNFALGFYSARLDVAYGISGEHAKKTVFIFVFPWQLTLVLLIIACIVIWGGKTILHRYNTFIITRATRHTEGK